MTNNKKKSNKGKLSSRLGSAMKRMGLQDKNPNKNKKGKPIALGYNDFRHSFVSYIRGKDKKGKPLTTPEERRENANAMHIVKPCKINMIELLIIIWLKIKSRNFI